MAEQNQNTNNLPTVIQIVLEEHAEFNNIISTSTLTTEQLERKISEMFKGTFDDFEGSKIITIGPKGQPQALKCKLYFKLDHSNSEGVHAIQLKGSAVNTNSAWYRKVSQINMASEARQFELTKYGEELLAEFIITNEVKPIKRWDSTLEKEVIVRVPSNWSKYTAEEADNVGPTKFHNPYFSVTVDLIPVISKLYGKKDHDEVDALAARGIIPKDRYQYKVDIVKALDFNMDLYILEIKRIDIKEMDKLSQAIGYGLVTGTIPMTRV